MRKLYIEYAKCELCDKTILKKYRGQRFCSRKCSGIQHGKETIAANEEARKALRVIFENNNSESCSPLTEQ